MHDPDQKLMQCMEVWGGNQAADNGVVMAGLDAWVFSEPFDGSTGGGDVYYVSSCATNRILRLLIADVSGHGAAVGNLGAELRKMMRRYVNHIDHLQFVRAMNQQFGASARAGIFATAVVSTFFAPTGRLTICNAGHPPPLLYRSDLRRWTLLEHTHADTPDPINLPLGIIDLGAYQTFDAQLSVGDLVVCYTDSLIESKNAAGQMLGSNGLLEIAQELRVDDPSQIIPALLESVGGQHPGNLKDDDVTVLLFRPNGLGRRRPSLWQQLIAAKRMLGAIGRSLRPGGEPVPWPDMKLPNIGGVMSSRLAKRWDSKSR